MFLIIDGSSLLTTYYFATLPDAIKKLHDREAEKEFYYTLPHSLSGKYNNALKGALKQIIDIIRIQKPTHIAVVLDKDRNTFRRDYYPDYKGNRDEKPEPLQQQFESFETILKSWGIKVYKHSRYEADDFAGSLVKIFENEEPCVVYTKDKDYYQLLSMRTSMWKPIVCKEENEYYPATKELPKNTKLIKVTDYYDGIEVRPEYFVDYLALVGDKADNVPGCKYVGEKAAEALITLYGTIENIYAEIDKRLIDGEYDALVAEWKNEGLRSNILPALITGRQDVFISKMLVKIKTDIPLNVTLEDFKTLINKDEYYKSIREYGLEEVLA